MKLRMWCQWISVLAIGLWPILLGGGIAFGVGPKPIGMADMVLISGGTFSMGDIFDEGNENERPVHEVTLGDFYLSKYEVTVGQLMAFVKETAYKTSAEAHANPEKRKTLEEQLGRGDLPREKMMEVYRQLLQLPGAGRWFTDRPRWGLHEPGLNWRNPGFEPQIDTHPVVAVSWNDAASYCNWLSRSEGLPEAYDLESGSLIDEGGKPTDDVHRVRGYRLPTEAEWEFAARERGRKVRFGNGQDVARSSEINFRADTVTHAYAELGDYRRGTVPVGSSLPNSLGLYDMSGNAWEWTSDCFTEYSVEAQTNPHPTGCDKRALRGGRWGGDASEIRATNRGGWYRNDRCNNSGFRIARSAFCPGFMKGNGHVD